MVRHDAACRRWRACVAMHKMSTPSCSCVSSHKLGEYPEGHWHDLSNFISALESSDVVVKTETLHHLAPFLLYAAPTSESEFTCPDANTISLHYEGRSISLALKDIRTLYRLIFVELANCIKCLFKSECSGKVYGQTVFDHSCSSHCGHANMEFTVKILQCCIYILPLLEFNTGLSLVAADFLNSLFKQLVCPASNFHLCFKEFDEVADNYRTLLLNCSHNRDRLQAFQCVQGVSVYSNTLLTSSVEASINGIIKDLSNLQNADLFCSHFSIKRDTSCPLHDKKAQSNRNQIALALLEVFLEELLLQPCLAGILKASDVLQSQFSPDVLVIEAAAMHFTFSVLGGAQTESLHKNGGDKYSTHHGTRLSLPAAVKLLDLSMDNDMDTPDVFLIHIINMLRCSLARSSCSIEELPGEIVLCCVTSALESATSLYFDCWKSNAAPLQHSLLQRGELLKFLPDKFLAICDGDAKKVALLFGLLLDQENNSKALQQENEATHSGLFCTCRDVMPTGKHRLGCFLCTSHINDPFHNGQQRREHLMPMGDSCFPPSMLFLESKTTCLVSVLQLISAALFCLIAEGAKNFQTSRTPNGKNHNPSNAEVYIRHVRQVFKFCASVDRIKVLSNLTLDKELQDVILEVDELTGNAFTFFVEPLLLCIKHDAPNALQQAYWEVLKCLLTLNFVLQRGISNSASAVELLCKARLRPTCVMNVEGDRHADEPSCSNGCKEDEDFNSEPCSGQCKKRTADFETSTMLVAKIYQRRRKRLVTTQRKSETSLAASQCEQLDGDCRLQEEGNLKKNEMVTPKYRISGNGDAYIKEVISLEGEVNGECFNDLSDFIVCKEGRNYLKWMKLRYKKRMKKMRKTVLQRMKAKKELISLLTNRNNDHF